MEQKFILLKLELTNPVRNSKHTQPCGLPIEAINMTKDEIKSNYSEYLVDVLFDLLQHKSFRQGLDKPKLITLTDE